LTAIHNDAIDHAKGWNLYYFRIVETGAIVTFSSPLRRLALAQPDDVPGLI